jgi:urease accessory protein
MKKGRTAGSRWPLMMLVTLVMTLFPLPAEAHLNSTGMGPVYDGLLHFFLSPEDMLAVLAMALFAGQRGAAHGRWALFALPGAWLAGGLFGLTVTAMNGVVLTFVPFLLVGGLLAVDAALPLSATTALGGLIGSFYGFLNGVDIGRAPDGALVLLGLVFAIFVVVAIASSFVVSLRQQWLRIAVRIVGSWIVASGLLMLGWTLRRS